MHFHNAFRIVYSSGSETGAIWLTREEFLISGRKFVPGNNWAGKAVEKA